MMEIRVQMIYVMQQAGVSMQIIQQAVMTAVYVRHLISVQVEHVNQEARLYVMTVMDVQMTHVIQEAGVYSQQFQDVNVMKIQTAVIIMYVQEQRPVWVASASREHRLPVMMEIRVQMIHVMQQAGVSMQIIQQAVMTAVYVRHLISVQVEHVNQEARLYVMTVMDVQMTHVIQEAGVYSQQFQDVNVMKIQTAVIIMYVQEQRPV